MSYKKTLIKNTSRIFGNDLMQRFLEKNVLISQFFMGIGAGANISTSGEKVVFKILQEKYKPPFSIFDVGANKGQFLELCLNNISSNNFVVHSFEPSRAAFNILQNSIGKDARVKLNNIGLGKEKTIAPLYYNTHGSSLASLTKRRLEHFKIKFDQSETIQIDTIDNYCLDNDINKIHLLKLDIEGHEYDALTGAVNMFNKQNAIDVVTFEFGGCNIDTGFMFQDFYYFFQDFNMKIYRITPSGYIFRIKSYKEIYEQFRTTNFIAMKE